MQLDGFITGMCCQVIRPDPCKSRCGRIFFFFYEQKKEPEVEEVEVKKATEKLEESSLCPRQLVDIQCHSVTVDAFAACK